MNDPRLNSVHLEFPRREDFRRARGMLLGARGTHTVALEKHEGLLGGQSRTLREDIRDAEPAAGCELYDIASKNGTYINGNRLSGPTQLSSGDEIRMCDRQFVFMSKRGA